jgi:oligoribonuclease NrnB/cAMP/cGMP phosphodiesterase (DHH superfamily)
MLNLSIIWKEKFDLWNKRYFEETKTEIMYNVLKYSVMLLLSKHIK